ncbi:zinc ribbon domain-containing protein [Halococcus sp. IIIV-5B]|uniref:zinc ribbon domain-containing protein n=1 Tax=Halococcus sp. IIIV-5B TaxID=2321230 RepID=UPI000E755FF7|nr:zinc ribbon domain-containing protein [Halococcus sp. IIIV-5B]RJT05414.1 zinc ribbon domain-containing protein [Halococcus sp. IIIV-5B]
MDGGWGSFRTIDGTASVGDEALHIERSPRKFLHGQRAHWRDGGRKRQLVTVGKLLGFLLSLLFATYQVSTMLDTTVGVVAALSLAFVALDPLHRLWRRTRGTRIELSTIERVTLDETDRELRLTHDASGRLARFDAWIRGWLSTRGFSAADDTETETTLTLLTDDDVRAARAALRARGISVVDDAPENENETETEYHYEIRNGVVFCDLCGSQVSPNDRVCPSCERPLKVERTTEPDRRTSREPAVEH